MTVSQPTLKSVQRGALSGEHGPLNLLNDFAELGALLLPMLEMASAPISAEPGPAAAREGAETQPLNPQGRDGHLLDALLLAVGMNQILEDYLHRDVLALIKISRNLPRLLPDSLGDPAVTACRKTAQALFSLRALLPGEQRLIKRQRALAAFIQRLADQFVRGTQEAAGGVEQEQQAVEELRRAGRDLLSSLQLAPRGLRRSVMRLPASFRSFDQRPADFQRIARRFAERWPERSTPLVVIGIRTSGSYLAPLYAAFLRALGYRRVQAFTLRPGQMWLTGERASLLKQVLPEGRALLVDDPPHTGASLIQIVHALEEMGVARHSIHPVAPIFGSLADVPSLLQGYEALYLPWEEWAIHQRLTAAAVEADLSALLGGQTIHVSSGQGASTEVKVAGVRNVERLPLAAQVHLLNAPVTVPVEDLADLQPFRGHVRGLYRAQLLDERSGTWFTHEIYVKGVGLGYLGTHSLTLAERLSGFLPEVYGVRDGLLYRAWIPEERRLAALAPVDANALAERVAAYAAARHQALGLPGDVTARLAGRHPLWLRGTEDVMSHAFERVAPLARPALVSLSKYLLLRPVKHAAVIDGSMAPTEWFLPGAGTSGEEEPARGLLKVGFDDRVFSNVDLEGCDTFYDLASAAAHYELATGEAAISDLLRQHYRQLAGESCSDERWLLYQLIALHVEQANIFRIFWSAKQPPLVSADRASPLGNQPPDGTLVASERTMQALEAVQRTISRTQERYLGERFLSERTPASAGPLCAIDLDGVLETGWLGAVSTTPAGALALRALKQHGYRPVIATGRSLDEVRERCRAYALAGGVAEYGAVIYHHLTGETRVLLSQEEQAALDALRSVLQGMKGVYVSSAYRSAIRAYQVRGKKRRGLTAEALEQALRQVPGRERLRVIPGLGQTDVMVTSVDKGTGLQALAEWLDGSAAHPAGEPLLAFAAGDTSSDLAMFRLAKHAFAPANADAALRDPAQMDGRQVHIMKSTFQAGLLQAVAQFLGHDPRRCSTCQPPAFSRETNLLLTVLAARDVHGWRKLKQAALLAGRLTLTKWSARRQDGQGQRVSG